MNAKKSIPTFTLLEKIVLFCIIALCAIAFYLYILFISI